TRCSWFAGCGGCARGRACRRVPVNRHRIRKESVMRKIGIATLALVSVIGSGATGGAQSALNGNGAPSGAHYNLSIIGVDTTADMTGGDGHVIFVQLNGGDSASSLNGQNFDDISKTNKIFLLPAPAGESFQVLDANATDANGAQFQLPADVSTART